MWSGRLHIIQANGRLGPQATKVRAIVVPSSKSLSPALCLRLTAK